MYCCHCSAFFTHVDWARCLAKTFHLGLSGWISCSSQKHPKTSESVSLVQVMQIGSDQLTPQDVAQLGENGMCVLLEEVVRCLKAQKRSV